MADGSEFSIELGVKGGGDAVSAADALANLAAKLELAGAAATQTSDAVKAGEAAYGQAEAAANRAASAVEKIGLAASAQRGKAEAVAAEFGLFSPEFQKASEKLAQLTARQTEAAAKAVSTSAAMKAEADALDKLKAAAGAATDTEARLKKQHDALKAASDAKAKSDKDAADAQTKSVGAAGLLEGAFAKLGGPLGEIGQKASGVGGAILKMGKSLGAAGPYVAAAVLAIAVATAFAAAAVAITRFGIESADAARTQGLLSAGIAQSVAGGQQLDAKLDELASTVPIARDELANMASELAKTGLRGDDLTNALDEAAVKAANLKFGPEFSKQMLSLDNQSRRLKSNLGKIFSGLKIEGFLEALSKGVDLFDKNSASAKAIKAVFESLFQPIVDGMTALIPKVIATFLQIEILALKALIAIKPYGAVLETIAIGFAIVGAAVIAVVAIFVAAGIAITAAMALVVALPLLITSKVQQMQDYLRGVSLSDIGDSLIQGLVDGITNAGPRVLSAITNIASSAVNAAKNALGIASPSKVFAEIGMHTAAGMEQGVDSGAPGVQGAVESLVTPPEAPAVGASSGASGGGSGTFDGATFNFYGVGGDAKAFAEEFRSHLAGLLAGSGGAVPSVV